MVIVIMVVTGISVLLLFFETAIPHLRGKITLERDQENFSGETVLSMLYIYSHCDIAGM